MKKNSHCVIALVALIREKSNLFILSSLAEQGVTDLLPAHGAVLNALLHKPSMQMSELAKIIERKKNTVTGLVSTLEERGYCYREKDPLDARAQLVILTDKGKTIKEKHELVSKRLIETVWHGIAAEDKDICMRVLQKIFDNFLENEGK